MLPSRTRKADFGAMCEFKILIDNPLSKDDAPKSVFLRRLGSTMFQITGHTGWCMADFTKLIAPKFFASIIPDQHLLFRRIRGFTSLYIYRPKACGTAAVGLRDFLQIYFRERYQYFIRFVLTFPPYKKIYF